MSEIVTVTQNPTQVISVITVGPQGPSGSGGGGGSNISDITGLQSALDGKAPIIHTHIVNDITDFDGTVLNGGAF